VNTINKKKKVATFAGPQCVVECGQYWNAASGVRVDLCRSSKLR
jgi:hypothetical protein